ncbi:hypothetical protein ACI78V_05335 [Geodermatophilus sp. SYSU D00742]
MAEVMVEEPLLVLNGIDVDTGDYLTPRVALADVAGALRGDRTLPPATPELRRRRQADEEHFGVVYGRDPQDLTSVGWGLVTPPDPDPAVMEALDPLLRLREGQAGELFRRLEVRPGEDKDDVLARYGMGPSVVDPRRVPYYLLILGSPAEVPFDVQYQLGVSYAVGRIDLEDPEACAAYAASVVAAERRLDTPALGVAPSARRLHLFATRHPGDVPTALSASRLVEPLHAELRETARAWQLGTDVGAGATRARLEDLLTGPEAPDLLFTASHGMGGRAAHRDLAGALLCQDWPGPLAARGPVDEGHYLAGHHLPAGAPVGPRVVFSFACFGAGTPQVSEYPGGPDGSGELTATGFTARLPQRLLGAPAGGALAFVGHVDRAWSCSFLWKGLTAQVTPFQSTLLALMDGARLGWAMESLTSRYAEIATELARRLDDFRRYGKRIDDAALVGLWTATHDARAYVVLGDPAVRVAPRGGAGLGPG